MVFPLLLVVVVLGAAALLPADAQAGVMPPDGAAGEPANADWQWQRLEVARRDGQGQLHLHLAIPRRPAPAAGWPALWMLDGNAARMALDPAQLQALARGQPPLLVFVSPPAPVRIDGPARTRDFTPVPMAATEPGQAAQGGHAATFLAELEGPLRQAVAAHVALDGRQQALWGHSLGGLFTLYAYYRRSPAFTSYFAASPSLWWGNGWLLGAPEQQFLAAGPAGARLLILQGGNEARSSGTRTDRSPAQVQAQRARQAAVAPDAARQLAQRLGAADPGAVAYVELAGLGHGPMLPASLRRVVHQLAASLDPEIDDEP